MLVGAGVFAARGELCVVLLTALAAAGAICGDLLGYLVGRVGARRFARYRMRLMPGDEAPPRRGRRWLERFQHSRTVRKALAWSDGRLERGGGMGTLIVLSRTLLSAFGPIVNVLSGVRRYPIGRFLLYDAVGELLWAGASVGAGFVAGMQGGTARQVVTHPLVIVGGVLLSLPPTFLTLRRSPRPPPASTEVTVHQH
jgi:membrane protein DedA with SNARE-associated domain